MSLRDVLLYRIGMIATREIFPKLYDGFLEIDELSKGEDGLLGYVRNAVLCAFDDKTLSTASSSKIAEYESKLGLSADGLTIDERRNQVIAYINRSRLLNEDLLHTLCQSYLPGFIVYERTDPRALTLGVFTTEDGEDGEIPAIGIVDKIRPIVPQNLALYAGVETSFDRGLVASYAHRTALRASLGLVVYTKSATPGLCVLDTDGELLLETATQVRHYTLGTVRIVGGEIAHWSKVYTFINIPQPTLGFTRITWTFQNVPQPAVGTISRQDAFEGIPQPTLGFFDGG